MSNRKAYSPNQHYMDRFLKAHNAAKARAEKRRAEELAEQQELQAIQDKIQQPQLTFDEQVAKANALLVSLGVTPIIKADAQPDTPEQTPDQPQLSEEEQYQTTIVSEMVALIKQRKKR
ncbi:hypothetical protein D3C75_625210 [compost metagenome]